MKDVREKIISEIKEVAERLDIVIYDYRIRYYKEMPSAVKKKIYNWLEKAVIETEALVFYSETTKNLFSKSIVEAKANYNTDNIYNYLDNVVNETLKYYNNEFVCSISEIITSLENKLVKVGYDISNDYDHLLFRLELSNCISLHEDKYPAILALQNTISIIRTVDSIRPGSFTPRIHELYGIKALLLELEENIKAIEIIEEEGYANIILEYIDSLIDWEWFEKI